MSRLRSHETKNARASKLERALEFGLTRRIDQYTTLVASSIVWITWRTLNGFFR